MALFDTPPMTKKTISDIKIHTYVFEISIIIIVNGSEHNVLGSHGQWTTLLPRPAVPPLLIYRPG